jgi:uncharacterized membrane protein
MNEAAGTMFGWLEFVIALGLFFATHALPVRPPIRSKLANALGERGFAIAYSGLSLGMLGWLIVAAGRAPHVEIWPFAPWQLWVPNLAMPIVILLLAFSIGAPNPLSFGGGRTASFDPARPGVIAVSRHPLLLALALWALGHLAPNGDLAHLVLFGLFAGFAVMGMAIIDRRKRKQLGETEWLRLAARTRWLALPDRALISPVAWRGLALRVAAGILVYAALFWLHAPLIGVSPSPP